MDVQANAGEVSELTLGYNFGRLHEANGDLKQAQTLFSVSKLQPFVIYVAETIPLSSACMSVIVPSSAVQEMSISRPR